METAPRTGGPSGFTPFVSALENTLEVAAGEEANIVAIGDAEDTCGRDICSTVPKLMRDNPNASLTFHFTDASNERLDAIGCIVNAKPAVSSLLSGATFEVNNLQLDQTITWDELEFLEQYYLFIVMLFALLWAVMFIFIYDQKATEAEKKTQNLNHQTESDANPTDSEEDDGEDLTLVDAPTPIKSAIAWISAILSALLLLLLLIVGESYSPEWLNFADARKASWYVANSAFATAFAILAISPVLFAAGQYWRHNQARHTYFVVSGEYAAEQRRIKEEKRRQEYQDYLRRRNEVGESQFSMPSFKSDLLTKMAIRRSAVRQAKFLSAQGVEQQKWVEVCNTVRILAKGSEAPQDKHSEVKREVTRLNRYINLKGPLKSLPEFIELMIADQPSEFEARYWKQLADGVRNASPIAINSSLRALTDNSSG